MAESKRARALGVNHVALEVDISAFRLWSADVVNHPIDVLVPSEEYLSLALDQIRPHIVPYQSARFSTSCFVAHNSSNNIKRHSHINEHCHDGPAEIVRGECCYW